MPRTFTTTVYKYAELTPQAQETARQWWRRCNEGDNSFAECGIEDFCTIAGLLGITIETRTEKRRNGEPYQDPQIAWSGFSSQGDGASFTGTYTPAVDGPAAVRGHAPVDETLHGIADALDALRVKYLPYELRTTITRRSSRYSHPHTVDIDTTAFSADEDEHPVPPADVEAVAELLRDLMTWLYRQLEAEYEYQDSDACIAENIEANAYDFTARGSRTAVVDTED